MSRQLIAVIAVAALAVGFTADLRSEKERKIGPFKSETPGDHHTMKVRGPLRVSLELLDTQSVNVGDVFVLRGTLTSRRALDADFVWSLPRGVEVVNGQVTGSLSVSNDGPSAVEITLKKISEGNAQIHLMAKSAIGEMRFADSAQFNTVAPAVAGVKRNKTSHREPAAPLIKIFQ